MASNLPTIYEEEGSSCSHSTTRTPVLVESFELKDGLLYIDGTDMATGQGAIVKTTSWPEGRTMQLTDGTIILCSALLKLESLWVWQDMREQGSHIQCGKQALPKPWCWLRR